jgi:hypothetical protein
MNDNKLPSADCQQTPSVPAPPTPPRAGDEITMPFGKYAGKPISEIRSWYLEWCLRDLSNMRQSIREAIEEELHFRKQRRANQWQT